MFPPQPNGYYASESDPNTERESPPFPPGSTENQYTQQIKQQLPPPIQNAMERLSNLNPQAHTIPLNSVDPKNRPQDPQQAVSQPQADFSVQMPQVVQTAPQAHEATLQQIVENSRLSKGKELAAETMVLQMVDQMRSVPDYGQQGASRNDVVSVLLDAIVRVRELV